MISPYEIKVVCRKKWIPVLLNCLPAPAGTPLDQTVLFPMELPRIGKVKTQDLLTNLAGYKASIEMLHRHSKQVKGAGYTIVWKERVFEKIGRNKVPDSILVETLDDYLEIVSLEAELRVFLLNSILIISFLPELHPWIQQNPLRVIEHTQWLETLVVCKYFLDHPVPNLYIRQLPVMVHTKFIKEENEALFRSLLDFLIPQYIIPTETQFEKRYNLKYAEPMIRIRYLDPSLSPVSGLTDLSVPLNEFSMLTCKAQRVVITENLMNFLTLPAMSDSIALWSGGGFNVSYLRTFSWLSTVQLLYWGDIDAHGFHILNQLRTYFANTISVMMDQETLDVFSTDDDKLGPKVTPIRLAGLNEAEHDLYLYLCETRIRLEQEKISQEYAMEKFMLDFMC